ncbi:MAG: hypothetical protein NVSMB1_03700 [Polyangiales bacterium]
MVIDSSATVDGDASSDAANISVTPGSSGYDVIALGGDTSCALQAGTVRCLGDNSNGQLGNGTFTDSFTAAPIASLTNVVQVRLWRLGLFLRGHACALINDGTVQCWGANHQGQLGDGTRTDRTGPVKVLSLNDVAEIAPGDGLTCVGMKDGTARCWGENVSGDLGDGTYLDHLFPKPVAGLTGVSQLSLAPGRSCALITDGTVKCWGIPLIGPQIDTTLLPQTKSGLANVKHIAAGEYFGCALLLNETVQCWGRSTSGSLGDGSPIDIETFKKTPGLVVGLSNVKQIALGNAFACALIGDGTVRCWGENVPKFGNLGNGSYESSSTPKAVVGLAGVSAISLGAHHGCAKLKDGSMKCWGSNTHGQLGDGTTKSQSIPIAVKW